MPAYKEPVVYVITNVINKKQYVGSTNNFSHRKNCHLSDLRNKKHPNRLLQEDFLLFGEENFIWSILYHMPLLTGENVRFEYEQYYINKLHSEYNLDPIAGKHIGDYIRTPSAKEKRRIAMTGRKQSPETVQKRIDTMKRNGKQKLKRLTDEQKKHLSEINTGRNNPNWGLTRTKETRQKQSKAAQKYLYVYEWIETGEVFKETNLQALSNYIEVPVWALRDLYNGNKVTYNGWRCKERIRLK